MKNFGLIVEKSDLEDIMKQAVKEGIKLYETEKNSKQLYTINEVCKKLGKAHKTVTQMVQKGILKTTADNRIPHQQLENYLMAQ